MSRVPPSTGERTPPLARTLAAFRVIVTGTPSFVTLIQVKHTVVYSSGLWESCLEQTPRAFTVRFFMEVIICMGNYLCTLILMKGGLAGSLCTCVHMT